MRPIDADVLVKKFEALKEWETLFNTYGTAILETNNMPTLKVEPVKHGHWIKCKSGNYKCSVCKATVYIGWDYQLPYNPYCRMCGAKMDEEVEE